MHNGDDVSLLFDTPEEAFEEAQGMFGVQLGAAFVVRRVTQDDIDPDEQPDVIFPNEALREHYPIWIGQNGAKWVRSQYMRVLFDILQGANSRAYFREVLAQLPDADPHKEKLTELLEDYLEQG
jgi:hypothetical protein